MLCLLRAPFSAMALPIIWCKIVIGSPYLIWLRCLVNLPSRPLHLISIEFQNIDNGQRNPPQELSLLIQLL